MTTETDAYGTPRYAYDMSPGDVFLGRYEAYDLYLCEQTGLPATLVARYGPGARYTTYNPTLLGRERLSWADTSLQVAYQRALSMGHRERTGG